MQQGFSGSIHRDLGQKLCMSRIRSCDKNVLRLKHKTPKAEQSFTKKRDFQKTDSKKKIQTLIRQLYKQDWSIITSFLAAYNHPKEIPQFSEILLKLHPVGLCGFGSGKAFVPLLPPLA